MTAWEQKQVARDRGAHLVHIGRGVHSHKLVKALAIVGDVALYLQRTGAGSQEILSTVAKANSRILAPCVQIALQRATKEVTQPMLLATGGHSWNWGQAAQQQ